MIHSMSFIERAKITDESFIENDVAVRIHAYVDITIDSIELRY